MTCIRPAGLVLLPAFSCVPGFADSLVAVFDTQDVPGSNADMCACTYAYE